MIFKDDIQKLNEKLKFLDTVSAVLSFVTVVIIFIEVSYILIKFSLNTITNITMKSMKMKMEIKYK